REALEIARGGLRIREAELPQGPPQAGRPGAAAGGQELGGGGVQTADSPVSPVRMRIDSLIGSTNTLPSPIEPVFAAPAIVSTTFLARASPTTTSIFTLGRKSTVYSEPRWSSVWPFCRPKPRTSVTVLPITPIPVRASFTSSSLYGLMLASTFF